MPAQPTEKEAYPQAIGLIYWGASLVLAVLAFFFLVSSPSLGQVGGEEAEVAPDVLKLHNCSITTVPESNPPTDGLECWGNNDHGQLGDGTAVTRYTPVMVRSADGENFLAGVTSFSTGYQHTCAVVSNDLFCWGRNNQHQLGQTSRTTQTLPTEVEGGLASKTVDQVAAGGFHTCARAGTEVHCWGLNSHNQTGGRGDHIQQPAATSLNLSVSSGATISLSAGGFHTCVESSEDGVKCFGRGNEGQLGDGENDDNDGPGDATWLEDLSSLSAGFLHTCALTDTGEVRCWGSNSHGQLGSGTIGENANQPTAAQQLNPTANTGSADISGANAIAAGHNHTCMIDSADRVVCWGSNGYGQLGIETIADGSTTPPAVPYRSINTGQAAVTPAGVVITTLTASTYHTCAESTDNRYCWGLNSYGSIGVGVFRHISAVPIQVSGISGATAITGGAEHTCAILGTNTAAGTEDTVVCWGNDELGQLGRQNRGASVSPIRPRVHTANTGSTTTTLLTQIDHATTISAGPDGFHTCATLEDTANTEHKVVCWGANQYFQSSPNVDRDTDTFTATQTIDPTVFDWGESDETYTQVAVGDAHTCVLVEIGSEENEVRCWGYNNIQQVGAQEVTQYNASTKLSEGWEVLGETVDNPVIIGSTSQTGHALLVEKPDLIAAGTFTSCILTDELGNDFKWETVLIEHPQFADQMIEKRRIVTEPHPTITDQTVPVTVPKGDAVPEEVLCWGDNLQTVDAHYSGNIMIEVRDRSLYQGQCLPTDEFCTPIGETEMEEVAKTFLTDIESIVVGSKHACTIQSTNGEVYCWGNNEFGQLAYDLLAVSSQYGQKVLMFDGQWNPNDPIYLTNVAQLSAGQYHTCALIDNDGEPNDGGVYCWGKNNRKQLGNPQIQNPWLDRAVPVQDLPGAAIAIGGGRDHTCAIMETDGAVYCWGYNNLGQVGSSQIISGVDDEAPEFSFVFAAENQTLRLVRAVNNRVQLPPVTGGDTDDLLYQIVDTSDQEYTLPAGLEFDPDSLTISGSPAITLAPVELKYQAIRQTDDTLAIEANFFLTIVGAGPGWVANNPPQILIDQLAQTELTVPLVGSLVIDLKLPQYVNEPDQDDTLTCTVRRVTTNDNTRNINFVASSDCVITFNAGPDGWGSDEFSLTVDDGKGGTDTTSFTVFLNSPPEITSLRRIFNTIDYSEDISYLFSDADTVSGDVLSFSLGRVTIPSDLNPSLVGSTLSITDPGEEATHRLELCATDTATVTTCGTLTLNWGVNAAPDIKLDDLAQSERVISTGGDDLIFDLNDRRYVEDDEQDPDLDCEITPINPPNPPHITVELNNCLLTFSAGEGGFGRAEFDLVVSDGLNSSNETIVVFQSTAPIAVATEFASVMVRAGGRQVDIDLKPKFHDPDVDPNSAAGDSLTYAVSARNPASLNAFIRGDNLDFLSVRSLPNPGMGSVSVCASDRSGQSVCETLLFVFTANTAPTLKSGTVAPIMVTVINGTTTTIDVSIYFEDAGDELSWVLNTVSGPTATVVVDDNDSALLNITGRMEGMTQFSIAASDGELASDNYDLEIAVTPNQPPTLKSDQVIPLVVEVGIGNSRQIHITDFFVDPDTPDDLVWVVSEITNSGSDNTDTTIATATVNADPALLDISGLAANSTKYNVEATDGISTTAVFQLEIRSVDNNEPVRIGGTTDPLMVSLSHGNTKNIDITEYYQDDDNDELTWIISNIGGETNETVATVVKNPTNPSQLDIRGIMAGTSVYHVAATDTKADTQPLRLEITVTNQTPMLRRDTTADPFEVALTEGETSTLLVDNLYEDEDDHQLSWVVIQISQTNRTVATVEINSTNTGQLDITAIGEGTTEYDLAASDGANTSTSQRLRITVTAPPPPVGGGTPGGGGPPGGVGGPGGGIPGGTPVGGPTPQTTPPAGDNRFADDDGNTHEANINLLAEMGISRGCNPPDNTEFCPDRAVTRGEMATFMVRAFTLDDTTDNLFGDDDGTTHETNINRLATAGITRGCNPPENSRYCPSRPVTRAQMATFLARALDLPDGTGDFTDTSTSVHSSDINRIASVGITRGCNPPTNSRYCPDRAVTRAEMATFLIRATNL